VNLFAASLAPLLLAGMLASPAPATCDVTDATLTWGFKESFRSYISGSIAHGEWTVSDGATYETPSFGWNDGSGTVPGTVAFTGSIGFTGHGGILDTTVANPRLVFDGSSTATLLLDVSGTTQEGLPVDAPAVEFATIELPVAADGAVITDAPVTLTQAGAEAFGTYAAGEALDPITVHMPGASGCGSTSGGISPLVAVVVSVGMLGLLVGLAAVVLRRRIRER